ncbi:hypothetical protein SPHINGOAX6_70652 [Sphingomonas sp. AX6]|nr:hypothetical protein SPHINGOAX6_70652 [Sphingomonas sp. AX6]
MRRRGASRRSNSGAFGLCFSNETALATGPPKAKPRARTRGRARRGFQTVAGADRGAGRSMAVQAEPIIRHGPDAGLTLAYPPFRERRDVFASPLSKTIRDYPVRRDTKCVS